MFTVVPVLSDMPEELPLHLRAECLLELLHLQARGRVDIFRLSPNASLVVAPTDGTPALPLETWARQYAGEVQRG